MAADYEPIQTFFSRFPDFNYHLPPTTTNSSRSQTISLLDQEFDRLRQHKHWKRHHVPYVSHYQEFVTAVESFFPSAPSSTSSDHSNGVDLSEQFNNLSVNPSEIISPLERFFRELEYQQWKWNRENPPDEEFDRLCHARNWGSALLNAYKEVFGLVKRLERLRSALQGHEAMITTPLALFFQNYHTPGFTYTPGAPPLEEFQKLCKARGWPVKQRSQKESENMQFKEVRAEFYRAVEEEFSALLEENDEDGHGALEPWEYLCLKFELGVPPLSKTKAKKLLSSLHVNIFDLIDYQYKRRNFKAKSKADGGSTSLVEPKLPRRFRSVRELSVYSYQSGNVYPLELAKDDGLLRWLLRPIRRGN